MSIDVERHQDMQEAFEAYAEMGNVNEMQLRQALLEMGKVCSAVEAKNFLNGKESLTYNEFSRLIEAGSKEKASETELTEAVNVLAKSSQGQVTAGEFRFAMRNMGVRMTPEDADAATQLATGGGTHVDIKNFVATIVQE